MSLIVTGLKEIDQVLAGLSKQINHSVASAAHAEAAKILVQEEHLLSPVGETGHLADSHGVTKRTVGRATALGEILVGPRRGRYKGNHAVLVEFGTAPRKQDSTGRKVGRVTATHYLERSFNNKIGLVREKINDLYGTKLYAFMRRTIKNAS